MTGVSWGRYATISTAAGTASITPTSARPTRTATPPARRGRRRVVHVPDVLCTASICPRAYGALDAGTDAVYPEEPEFWVRAGTAQLPPRVEGVLRRGVAAAT